MALFTIEPIKAHIQCDRCGLISERITSLDALRKVPGFYINFHDNICYCLLCVQLNIQDHADSEDTDPRIDE
jgi:hypothetical protein